MSKSLYGIAAIKYAKIDVIERSWHVPHLPGERTKTHVDTVTVNALYLTHTHTH